MMRMLRCNLASAFDPKRTHKRENIMAMLLH